MMKFYANVKWCLQLVLQNPKGESKMVTSSIENEPLQYTKELMLHRFYVQVETVLCHIMQLELAVQNFDLHSDSTSSASEQTFALGEQQQNDLIDLLTSGIIYLLLAEIVLRESPPTINAYIQSGTNSNEMTHSILLRWLINRNIKPLHPHEEELLANTDLASDEPFFEEVHESLIECLMHTYVGASLQVDEVVEAIDAMNEGRDIPREYPYDIEDALVTWFNHITIIFHMSSRERGKPKLIEDLWSGISDGIAVAKAIIAYRPDIMGKNNQFFSSQNNTLQERIYNWQRILDICDRGLNVLSSFSPSVVAKADESIFKSNLVVFLVDLFCTLVYEVEDDEDDENSDYDEISSEEEELPIRRSTSRDQRSSVVDSVSIKMKQSQLIEVQHSQQDLFATTPRPNILVTSVQSDQAPKRNLLHELDAVSSSKTGKKQRKSGADIRQSISVYGNQIIDSESVLEYEQESVNDLDHESNEMIEDEGELDDEEDEFELEPIKFDSSARINSASSAKRYGRTVRDSLKHEEVQESKVFKQSTETIPNFQPMNSISESIVQFGSIAFPPPKSSVQKTPSLQQSQQKKQPFEPKASVIHKSVHKPSRDDIEHLLEQKMKENDVLRVRLQEQERQIEEERKLLKKRLEEEKYKIEQEAIKNFIESTRKEKKPPQQQKSMTESDTRSDISTSSSHKKSYSSSATKSTDSTRSDTKTPDSKWKQNQIIQIMPQENRVGADKRKRQQQFEEMRKKKLQEENQRKQELAKQRKEPSKSDSKDTNFAKKNLKTHARTNKQLIKNAICHVCLAGRVNEREKYEILSILQDHSGENDHFVILVRDDKSPVFKALYTLESENQPFSASQESNISTGSAMSAKSATGTNTPILTSANQNSYSGTQQLRKLIGKGPKSLTPDMVKAFFKYDSGGKRFIIQPTRSFAVTTDAVVLSEQIARKLAQKKLA